MNRQKFTIISDQGIHLRPASKLAQILAVYKSDAKIWIGEDKYDAKSIMAITSTGLKQGEEFELCIDGPDEDDAMEKAAEFIKSGMGDLD